MSPPRNAVDESRHSWRAVVRLGAAGAASLVAMAVPSTTGGALSPVHQQAAPARVQPVPITKTAGTVPPNNPPQNIPPSPNFLSSCSGTQYDNSASCTNAVLQAIANARAHEGLGGMTLPSGWYSLTPAEQLFVATDIERRDRGLTPLSGMATALDQSAVQGAQQSQDPQPPSGFPWSEWGSNWAGAVGNSLEAIYYWMYDDGLNSGNVDCTQSNTSGCWGHRDNVLLSMQCQPCVMGTGMVANGYQGYPSWAEILVDTSGNPQLDFSWSQVEGGDPPSPQTANGAGPGSAPGVVEQSNGAPSMFVQGPGNSLLNYWYIPQSGSWGSATVAGLGSTFSSPGVVEQTNGSPSVFVVGPGNSLLNYWYIPQSGSWGAATVAGGGSAFSVANVIEQVNGAPSVFVEGPGNSLLNYWYIPQSGTWGAATVAGPGSTTSSPALLEQPNGAPSVFVQGPGNSLLNYWYIPQSGSWGAATVAGGGSATSVPSVVEQTNGSPSVFVVGPGNSLLNYWYIPQSGSWGAATVAGGGTAFSSAGVIEQTNGAPSIFFQGPGNSLLNYWYIPQTGSWGAATVAGQGSASSSPNVVEQSNGAPSVFTAHPELNYWYIPSTGSWGAATINGD